jgi:hypothetical protein
VVGTDPVRVARWIGMIVAGKSTTSVNCLTLLVCLDHLPDVLDTIALSITAFRGSHTPLILLTSVKLGAYSSQTPHFSINLAFSGLNRMGMACNLLLPFIISQAFRKFGIG